ncbi:trimethylamine methyltransferase family protein [Marivita geojedonensis]|uniref:trimethylamine methyltransferase family protein n=1 Tax=Marivita geojedonensis TaxID=1123756 RepID=UPI000A1F6817|nr:trimethylamine methyltransferase family protein [Marivita geojedonensis]PRY80907.1 trimethylamine--corrinoid protein Co-methyltransferase [Marivita geojedonensis]
MRIDVVIDSERDPVAQHIEDGFLVSGQLRRAGRKERIALRKAKPAFDPCPPGQIGGAYKPLSEAELNAIFDTALRLLETLGLGEVPERLRRDLEAVGAKSNANGRVCFPARLVHQAIDQSAKTFALHGRDSARSIEVGLNRVHFGTGGAAVQTLDLETRRYRPSTLRDLHDFTRLQDTLTNVSWYTRCCVATDVPDNYDLDVNTAYALLRNTTKPVATSFTLASHVAPIVEMLDIAAGGQGRFSERPFLKAHISPIISPMRFGEDAVEVVYECIRHNIPMSCITAAQAGATAPATMAGFLAQSLAETLASLVMVHAIQPGFPMVFSNWPLVVDLRTGAFAGGSGETALLNAASAQVSNWLGLPSGVACSMTDAKAIDAQYGMEKGLTSLAAALAGGNLIYESSGMTASLLGASFEAFVLDDEMHSNTYRILRGIEVSEENLGYEAIVESVLGEGHFLGGFHTYAAMERDYFYPSLADRSEPRSWAEGGAKDAWDRAHSKVRDLLATHNPEYLTPEQDAEIRTRFNILYPA